jgi:hypothetical protein
VSPTVALQSLQHVDWNRQTDLLRRLQLDHELELRRITTQRCYRCGQGNVIVSQKSQWALAGPFLAAVVAPISR